MAVVLRIQVGMAARLPSGTKYLWVQADGDWTYAIS